MKSNTVGYITVVFLLSMSGIFSFNLYFQQRSAQDRLDIRMFPDVVGEWRGRDIKLSEKEYDILETRNLILREYVNPEGEKLFLFIVYSESNRSVFHPPEVCLMGSGVRITDKKSEEIDYGKNKFLANKLYLEKNGYKELALYCYKAGNLYTDNYYLQQAYFAVNQLLRRHLGGATIRVSMAISGNEGTTLATLKTFIVQVAKIVDSLPLKSDL